jgi:hypothetical protein
MMAPLVGLPLVFVCAVAWVTLAVGLSSVLPRIRCGKWTRRIVTVALFLVALPAFIWCATNGSKVLLVVVAYGLDEYTAGLRIINKHGELSYGRSISDIWMGVWGALLFLSVAVPTLPLVVFRLLTDRANPKREEPLPTNG